MTDNPRNHYATLKLTRLEWLALCHAAKNAGCANKKGPGVSVYCRSIIFAHLDFANDHVDPPQQQTQQVRAFEPAQPHIHVRLPLSPPSKSVIARFRARRMLDFLPIVKRRRAESEGRPTAYGTQLKVVTDQAQRDARTVDARGPHALQNEPIPGEPK